MKAAVNTRRYVLSNFAHLKILKTTYTFGPLGQLSSDIITFSLFTSSDHGFEDTRRAKHHRVLRELRRQPRRGGSCVFMLSSSQLCDWHGNGRFLFSPSVVCWTDINFSFFPSFTWDTWFSMLSRLTILHHCNLPRVLRTIPWQKTTRCLRKNFV